MKTNVARDSCKVTEALDEKKIRADGDVTMIGEKRSWDLDGVECRDAGSSRLAGHIAFEDGNVRSVDGKCAFGVIMGDGTVAE